MKCPHCGCDFDPENKAPIEQLEEYQSTQEKSALEDILDRNNGDNNLPSNIQFDEDSWRNRQ